MATSFRGAWLVADAPEIDRGAETPVTFTNSRWLKPIDHFREDLYPYSPKGSQYTADGLRARWGRWLVDTDEGRLLRRRWKEWIASQIRKYEWDIEPDEADHPMVCAAPASWRGPNTVTKSTRSPTTLACPVSRTLHAIPGPMRVGAEGQRRLRLVHGSGSGD